MHRQIVTEREINYAVFDHSGYFFRLVPTINDFEISKLDKSLDVNIDERIAYEIGEKILSYFP